MFSLNYKTRGGKYPNRKPRVFFCSHPKDFHLLDHISEQLLKAADCSIWYMQNEPETAEERQSLFTDLADMQLFVVPVTSVFLNSHSYASQQLIPFFLEKKVPFLPLMQEAGLAGVFTQTYGSIQYLFEFDQSTSALPFSLKLEKYLQTVLMKVSIDSIQKAFRARIFISYRKKDRNYARNLMKMIHKESEFEDVAIWYDEYLVPGEDFHDSIADAIDDCNVFLLVVTPNLVNERNYIETKEYPYAIKAAKPVIPCEVQNTSHTELERRYKEIPSCVNIKDVHSRLSAFLSGYPSVCNTAPQYKYIIGLAYLQGIDVEVDRDLGIRLIRQAAESGYKDAVRFMCMAYRYGNGVGQDFEKAFAWQKRTVQLCADSAAKMPNRSTVCELIAESSDLGMILQEAGKYEEGIACYKEILKYIERYKKALNQYETVFWKLNVLIIMANLSYSLGRFDQSAALCKNILESVNNLETEYKDYKVMRIKMQAYEKLGTICFYHKDFASALAYYQACYEIARNSFEGADKDELVLYQAEGMQEIAGRIGGDIQLMSMDAMDYIMLQCNKDYAVACTKVADAYLETGRTDEAIKYYRLAEGILKHLVEVEIGVTPVQRELGLLYRKMGDAYADKKKYGAALEKMLEACKAGEYILLKNRSAQYQWDVAVYYYQTAQLYYIMGQKPNAQMYFEKALDIVNKQNQTPQIKAF